MGFVANWMKDNADKISDVTFREDIRICSVHSADGYAASVEYRHGEESVTLQRSGFIFDNDKEALAFAMEMKRNMKKQFHEYLSNFGEDDG
jgi:hypothetical protein